MSTLAPLHSYNIILGTSGLNLSVELENPDDGYDGYSDDPYSSEPEDEEAAGDEEEDYENDEQLLVVGNVTFLCTAVVTAGYTENITFFYMYIVRGPSSDEGGDSDWTHHANWTWDYQELGVYNYTVHAISQENMNYAHYANVTGTFRLLGELLIMYDCFLWLASSL